MSGLVDLHRHLDGSLRPATVRELAAQSGLAVPVDLLFRAGMGLEAALASFGFTLALLQTAEAITRVADEMCADATADGVDLLEIRFAPQLHGIGIEQAIDAALEGARGRAGLILCGLYGESPDVLRRLVAAGASRPGVVGIDLAGGPSGGQSWLLADYAGPFAAARDAGLGRTVHASEGRPPAEIQIAIEELGAQRIGHGTTLLDDPGVLELVLRTQTHIEACPSSNVHTGAIDSVASHPIRSWLEAGVRVSICTDNTLLSDTSLSEEIRRVADGCGLGADHIEQTTAYARQAAFRRG